MLPDGKLYVRGAEETIPAMKRLVARRARPESCTSPPPTTTSSPTTRSRTSPTSAPPIRRTASVARAVRGRFPRPSRRIPFRSRSSSLPERYLAGREFLLLKKSFDVFTNPNTERLLDWLDPDEIVVFGVATDVCDDAAIRGFLARGLKVSLRRGRRPRAGRRAGRDAAPPSGVSRESNSPPLREFRAPSSSRLTRRPPWR